MTCISAESRYTNQRPPAIHGGANNAGKPDNHTTERTHRISRSLFLNWEARRAVMSSFLRLASRSIDRFQALCCLDRQRASLLLYALQNEIGTFEQRLCLGIAPLDGQAFAEDAL